MAARKILKILHTLGAAGLIGGLGAYMLLLLFAPQDTPAAYADLRRSIAMISGYGLVPSLALALITGVAAMMVHKPFQDQRWVWLKALMGLAMFEGTLVIIGGRTKTAAAAAEKVALGEPAALEAAIANEWGGLSAIAFLSFANVAVGVWRPRLKGRGAA